jgi:alkylation response protein AidB-like acyl-CoA dehydrogenase
MTPTTSATLAPGAGSSYQLEHELFRETVRDFIVREVLPHERQWDRDGIVPRAFFTAAAEAGVLGFEVPEEHGGAGIADFRFNAVIAEEIAYACVTGAMLGLVLHNDVCLPYFLRYASAEQRERWLPGIAAGELVTAIAMTEPGTGSDLQGIQTTAVRDGDRWRLSGSKTFITNGINADLVIVAACTDRSAGARGFTLFVVERDAAGFSRGRNLEKLGLHAQDTAELFFDDVELSDEQVLGEVGLGLIYLMSNLVQERMSLAVGAQASAEAAVRQTIDYVRERKAFGRSLGALQHVRFELADLHAEVEMGRAYLDRCLHRMVAGTLTPEEAAIAKWRLSDMQGRVLDRGLQLFGGYGYMTEYPISRAYADARVTRIFGGANEIMKEIVGRSLQLNGAARTTTRTSA